MTYLLIIPGINSSATIMFSDSGWIGKIKRFHNTELIKEIETVCLGNPDPVVILPKRDQAAIRFKVCDMVWALEWMGRFVQKATDSNAEIQRMDYDELVFKMDVLDQAYKNARKEKPQ